MRPVSLAVFLELLAVLRDTSRKRSRDGVEEATPRDVENPLVPTLLPQSKAEGKRRPVHEVNLEASSPPVPSPSETRSPASEFEARFQPSGTPSESSSRPSVGGKFSIFLRRSETDLLIDTDSPTIVIGCEPSKKEEDAKEPKKPEDPYSRPEVLEVFKALPGS